MDKWFVKWRPYTGNLETTPVGINEYLPIHSQCLVRQS